MNDSNKKMGFDTAIGKLDASGNTELASALKVLRGKAESIISKEENNKKLESKLESKKQIDSFLLRLISIKGNLANGIKKNIILMDNDIKEIMRLGIRFANFQEALINYPASKIKFIPCILEDGEDCTLEIVVDEKTGEIGFFRFVSNNPFLIKNINND